MAELTEELRVLVTAEVDRAIKQLGSLDKKTKSTESEFKKLGQVIGSAFATKEFIFKAYQHAIENQYRFFSFGDAMIIL